MIPASMIRLSEFARIAELELSTAYVYHSRKFLGFPEPNFTIGRTHFWKRSAAVTWARKHKRLTARSKSHG
jgi:hypothetical protein